MVVASREIRVVSGMDLGVGVDSAGGAPITRVRRPSLNLVRDKKSELRR
jgi:hypothetical protein